MSLASRSKTKTLILKLLDQHRVLALATLRPDGWPQATLVGYVNDGFMLYCVVSRNSQKLENIRTDPRVSATLGSDAPRPSEIEGLSLGGRCFEVTDAEEVSRVSELRLRRYPEYEQVPAPVLQGASHRLAPDPDMKSVALLRIEPQIISVLDYSKHFGHSELLTFSEWNLDVHVKSATHRW